MDDITLRKVQLVQLEIAKEIDEICTKNNIKYYLIGGSLLGAIRHEGFIPWDDDLDVGMLRKDYNKFLKIAPNCLNSKYKLVDWVSDSNYPHPMAKVIKLGTVYKESKRKDCGEQGVWVDIFPYDNVENKFNKFKKRVFRLKILRSMIRAKCGYETWHSNSGISITKYLKNLPFRILSCFSSKEKLVKKYESISNSCNSLTCEHVFENGTEDYIKWVFKKEYFENLKEYKFENIEFYGPNKYYEYLTIAYGNFMKLPPLKERENRHSIIEVDFGKQDND